MTTTTAKVNDHVGLLWFTASLFTIGYCNLTIFQSLLALFAWPYYVGLNFAP